ncbi:MAG: DUF4159 domain-containing protein [Planctomycetota bacterium]
MIRRIGILILSAGVAVSSVWVQNLESRAEGNPIAPGADQGADRFTFVRVRYDSTGGFGQSWYRHEGRDWQRWETDYPRAEKNLLIRLKQITSLRVSDEPRVVRLTDEDLLDHPFLFMSDVGWQRLSAKETEKLATYLQRGGFLWADDFWGDAEWRNFQSNVGDLRPNWKWRPVPKDHPIMTNVYRLDRCPQIPARIFFASTGLPHDPPGMHRQPAGGLRGVREVHFMGLFDTDERLLAVATHNTDIADGWEREGESKEFFDRFSIKSYAITINILVYAMTH